MSEAGVSTSSVRTGHGPPRAIHRFEVRAHDDARGQAVRRQAAHLGIHPGRVRTARVYLLAGSFTDSTLRRLGDRLLADPVLERWRLGADPVAPGDELIEVHPLPGVMDPAAHTVRESVRELLGVPAAQGGVEVVTGWRYDVSQVTGAQADEMARGLLANEVIEAVHRAPWEPRRFPAATPADQRLRHVPIRDLDDDALDRLSRDAHLFLSTQEMRAIRAEYERLAREPTDVELETLAQTWSEHCVHKTLKSTIRITPPPDDAIDWAGRPGHEPMPDGSVVIHNLLGSTVAAATHELIADGCDWALSVFVDNAGAIAFDEDHAVCVKVETHNHPSAIEPYAGAATGIGGVIRDIMGTGLGAKPVACTDVFCVAHPDLNDLPAGCLHPRRVLTRVVDGVRDYANRMGIPTVNGAVWFDDRYVGNPLVFAGCVGVMRREHVGGDAVGQARPDDVIVALGGRTGRDGIHGATFSSAELTDSHADEFGHAVQIGNAIEQKRVLDALLRARDAQGGCLYGAITDCGAGGFSSAIGEMGRSVGAVVELSRAPLKYAGLRYDEIWISESQERMVLAVPPQNLAPLRAICAEEHVEMAELGTFGVPEGGGGGAGGGGDDGPELVLRYEGAEVGRLAMRFLHEGLPMPVRDARWTRPSAGRTAMSAQQDPPPADVDVKATLLDLLAHPNIASKRWIVRQYDHEVQGNTLLKPLIGPGGIGPGDAAVIQPVPGSKKGLAIACGMAIPVGDPDRGGDPYLMALAAVDECVRNLVCVGANPDRIAILDNFCWPSCDRPESLGALVRAAEGCYDAAKAYRTPFISGKDSLNNQFRTGAGAGGRVIEIPPTLLITGVGIVDDVARCVTMDLKRSHGDGGFDLVLVGEVEDRPEYVRERGAERVRVGRLAAHAEAARCVDWLIQQGIVAAAHDVSEGGLLTAVAEMALASDGCGASLESQSVCDWDAQEFHSGAEFFREVSGLYVLQLAWDGTTDGYLRLWDTVEQNPCSDHSLVCAKNLGRVTNEGVLEWGPLRRRSLNDWDRGGRIAVKDLRRVFLGGLDW